MNDIETRDEVIREMRKIKEALAESMDSDIDRILEDAREKEKKSGRQVLSPPIEQTVCYNDLSR